MVTFQCEVCVKALKKKQAERHNFECRGAQYFTCLTCWAKFDFNTIKNHIACVTEEEKYQKGDNTAKKNGKTNNKVEIVPIKLGELKWKGFRKTAKKVLMSFENYKLNINDLADKLAEVFANNQGVDKEEVCVELVKKNISKKLEDIDTYVFDLSRNTIRYKK